MAEQSTFSWQLKHSNLLYLAGTVLVLLDLSYQSRFWTQLELWLSLQEGTPGGLLPASEQHQRAHAWPIHSATDEIADSLLKMWRTKKPKEAHEVLARPDVRVTNKSDKAIHLPKILRLDEDVRNAFAHKAPAAAPASAAVAGDGIELAEQGLLGGGKSGKGGFGSLRVFSSQV